MVHLQPFWEAIGRDLGSDMKKSNMQKKALGSFALEFAATVFVQRQWVWKSCGLVSLWFCASQCCSFACSYHMNIVAAGLQSSLLCEETDAGLQGPGGEEKGQEGCQEGFAEASAVVDC